MPTTLVIRFAQVNGEPDLVNYLDGKPRSMLTIDVADDRIRVIHIVTNPQKLFHLPDLPTHLN